MIVKGLKITLAAMLTALLAASPALAASSASPDTGSKSRLIDLWQPGDTGQRMNIRGRVTSVDGTPLPGIAIQIRQPDGDGQWTEQYRTVLTTDDKGRYQFGSVVPETQYCGAPHVQVTVYQDGWAYYDTSIVFDDPDMAIHLDNATPIFLEESTVKGETIMFGQFDIVLSPE